MGTGCSGRGGVAARGVSVVVVESRLIAREGAKTRRRVEEDQMWGEWPAGVKQGNDQTTKGHR